MDPIPAFPGLSPGAKLRVVAPANFVTKEDLAPGRAKLETAGFEVEYCPRLFEREGQFAGSDQVRAASLMDAFVDKSVDGILCARGGYGSPRILPLLNWDKIAENAKPFVGYSDLTAVLARLIGRCGMQAFHGPVLRDLGPPSGELTASSLVAALKGEVHIPDAVLSATEGIAEGKAEGPLVGGNLTMLASICGTDAKFAANGAILLLEDISEYIYRLDRALVQLRQSGALKGVRGVVVSDLVDVEDGTVPFGMSAHDMIASHFHDVPILAGVPAGHGADKLTLRLGAQTQLIVSNSIRSLSQSL